MLASSRNASCECAVVMFVYSWFVDCSREKAEAILSLSRQYGSVLMRPVDSDINNMYAISYRQETGGSVPYRIQSSQFYSPSSL